MTRSIFFVALLFTSIPVFAQNLPRNPPAENPPVDLGLSPTVEWNSPLSNQHGWLLLYRGVDGERNWYYEKDATTIRLMNGPYSSSLAIGPIVLEADEMIPAG